MVSRRNFIRASAQLGVAGATSALLNHSIATRAFAQMPSTEYKAIVVITMQGGNDGNNMMVPMSTAEYREYSSIRSMLALPQSSLNALQSQSGHSSYGLHPALTNVARLYNQGRAAVVANVGPLTAPVTKQLLLAGAAAYPDSMFAHPNGVNQWESASAYDGSFTGWGGRIADLISAQSGSLPPVLNASVQSLFTVGRSVQAVAVQGGQAFPALAPDLQQTINVLASNDLLSGNALVRAAAKVRQSSLAQQAILTQAASYKSLSTTFGGGFSTTMQTIAQLIAGRSVVGATRQIFYTQQGSYDSHASQMPQHQANLQGLDQGLGSFFNAMDEIGMSNQVLVCTHSDFNRTFTPNVAGGSDHAWGSHQLLIGGGIKGGQVLGTMPALDLNGSDDLNGLGIWIPTTSVVQLTSGIASWMGLTPAQVGGVFPELSHFPSGALTLS